MRTFLRFLLPLFVGIMIVIWWQNRPLQSVQAELGRCSEWADIPFTDAKPTNQLHPQPGQIAVAPKAIGFTPEMGDQNWLIMFGNFEKLVTEIERIEGHNQITGAINEQVLMVDFIGSQDQGFDDVAQLVVSQDDQVAQIIVGTLYMSRLIDDYAITYAEAAIWHEFIHYRQWVQSTDVERALFHINNERKLSAQECGHLWRHEYEAWLEGCDYFLQFATAERIKSGFICSARQNDAAFRQQIYRAYLPLRPECAQAYAEAAGHPSGGACTP